MDDRAAFPPCRVVVVFRNLDEAERQIVIGADEFAGVDRAALQRRVDVAGGDLLRAEPPTVQNGLFAALFFAGAIAMAGMPPLSGFLGKLLILDGLRDSAAMTAAWIAILVGSLLLILQFPETAPHPGMRHGERHEEDHKKPENRSHIKIFHLQHNATV